MIAHSSAFIIKKLLSIAKTESLSCPSSFAFNCLLLLIVCCFLWWIFYRSSTLFYPAYDFLFLKLFPVSYLFPIICISTMGFVISRVKLLYILITVAFGNPRQSNFQNVYFFVFAVNPALQFPFLGKFRKSFQDITFLLQLIAFSLCIKDNPVLPVQFLLNL